MPVASEGLSSMKRRFVSRLPAVHPETKITNLAALNVNEMKDDMLESIDVSSLVNLKDLKTNVEDLPNLGPSIDVSLDDLSDQDLSQVCAVCLQDKPTEENQLIECSHCKKKFHTTCLGLPAIPYNPIIPLERRKREAYMEQHYKNWLCGTCKKDADLLSTQSRSPSTTCPGSPISTQVSSIASPPFSPALKPVLPSVEPQEPLDDSLLSTTRPGSPMLSGYPGSPLFSTMHPGSPGLMPQPNPLFRPPIKCPQGTDLSNGGVVVSTGDYAAMQKAYQVASGAIPTVPNANSVPALHLDPGLVPIYTDSDDGSVSPSEEKPRSLLHGEHHKHIKPEKLASFLRSLLGIADDSKENDSFISDVVKSVVKNGNEKEMEIVCPIPVCVLKSMLKTAVFNPSSVPVSKVSVIDGKEVVRIGDHPQLKSFFERVKKGEDVEAVKKDMVSEGLDGEVLLKDPNTVVLLDDYTISFIRADKAKPMMEPASPLHAASSSFKDEDSVLLAEDPAYSKYVKMLTRKIPREAVLDCMKKDGVDASVLDKLISGVEKKSGEKKSVVKKMVKLCEHPKYAKYFNMLKKGVPLPGVRHCMMRDGVDADVSVLS